MSVNVRQHCGAVKTKIVISAALALAVVLELAQAGPQIGISARAGARWCAPASTVCPPFKPYSQVRYLRLADLLLPVVLWLRFVTSRRFDQLQQCLASFRQRPNGNLPRSGPDHFSSAGDNSGRAHFRLATLISPAEVRPSSGLADQGRPPLILREARFRPGVTGEPGEVAPALTASNSPVDKARANTELRFHGCAQERVEPTPAMVTVAQW